MVKNKILTIITVFVVILLATASILTISKQFNTEIDPKTDVKGDTTDICIKYEKEINDALLTSVTTRNWYLKSDIVDDKSIDISLDLFNEDIQVSYLLNTQKQDAKYENNKWNINIPIKDLETGNYTLEVIVNNCENEYTNSSSFNVSQPVYVVWSIDWEGFDVKEEYLTQLATISSENSAPMTHFFNPYIYIYLSSARSKYLTDWVKSRDEYIGLHLHMYTKLVEAAGVIPDNSVAWGSPTSNGHDTPNSTYNYSDFNKIIFWSINQFERNGLPRPTIYRAGGWFLDEENLKVLNDLEFTLDSSGRTYYVHGSNQLKGEWHLQPTTQPYQMNSSDQNVLNSPNMTLWQYPNNGGDSWAYTSEKLIERFNVNYKGGISTEKIVVTYITHPHWLNKEGPNISPTLNYINNYSYQKDKGPVLFTTLDKVHQDIVN